MRQIISFKKEVAFKTMIGEITSISLEHTLHFSTDSTIEGDLIVSGTYKMTEASTLEETFNYALPVDIMLTSDLEEKDRNVTIDNFVYRIVNEEVLELEVDVLVKGLEKIEIEEEQPEERVEEKEKISETFEVLEPVEEKNEATKEAEIFETETLVEELRKADDAVTEAEVVEDAEERLEGEEEIAMLQAKIDAIPSVTEDTLVIDPTPDDMVEDLTVSKTDDQVLTEQNIEKSVDSVKEAEEVPVMNSIFSAFANTKETYTTYSVYILREEDTIEDVLNKYQVSREELSLYNNLDNLSVGSKLIIPTTINA